MARFKYKGRDKVGIHIGKVTADSRRDAMLKLKNEGLRIIEIEEIKESIFTKEISIGQRVKLQQMIVFLKQFSTLLKAGVSVVDATRILSAQTDNKILSKALNIVEGNLREGIQLSEALSHHRKIFDPLLINMVKAGELSGTLDETLERLCEHYEKQHKTRQNVISALVYPFVVGFIAVGVVIFLLIGVVPTFVSMFESVDSDLPSITKFVLGMSHFIQHFWLLILLFVILLGIGFVVLRGNRKTKYYLDLVLLKTPFFGAVEQKAVIAQMTRTLSSMLASSVPILQALAMVEQVIQNEVVAKVINRSRHSLEGGQSLANPIKEHWVFPPLVSQMIVIGEQTGQLDSLLDKVADFYEKEVELATERMKSLIEPILIVALALMVGTIVAAIIVPMYSIFDNLQNY
ncbi:type II secretion system F family protein [Bacillus sp. FJAT-49732]|uniref:Type II secretion system F family protein n=1 Tax=Lederbergia citrisecunda TaxID=2833583 RepID=A0A942YMZ7_9BACI|nr:type II secretion system F family protein [Lederbergia citrisecunda]MBS4199821.1 type II secretion system F family protein [Lederbergia citrisecunda]